MLSLSKLPSPSTPSLSPLDRTRLLIGVVMIPLAATCIFAAGVYSQAHFRSRAAESRPVELRAIYSDQERREKDSERWLAAAAEQGVRPGGSVEASVFWNPEANADCFEALASSSVPPATDFRRPMVEILRTPTALRAPPVSANG